MGIDRLAGARRWAENLHLSTLTHSRAIIAGAVGAGSYVTAYALGRDTAAVAVGGTLLVGVLGHVYLKDRSLRRNMRVLRALARGPGGDEYFRVRTQFKEAHTNDPKKWLELWKEGDVYRLGWLLNGLKDSPSRSDFLTNPKHPLHLPVMRMLAHYIDSYFYRSYYDGDALQTANDILLGAHPRDLQVVKTLVGHLRPDGDRGLRMHDQNMIGGAGRDYAVGILKAIAPSDSDTIHDILEAWEESVTETNTGHTSSIGGLICHLRIDVEAHREALERLAGPFSTNKSFVRAEIRRNRGYHLDQPIDSVRGIWEQNVLTTRYLAIKILRGTQNPDSALQDQYSPLGGGPTLVATEDAISALGIDAIPHRFRPSKYSS